MVSEKITSAALSTRLDLRGVNNPANLLPLLIEVKRLLVVEALRRAGGSRVRAAALLGISVDSLKHYMQTFDLYGRPVLSA